MHPQASHSDKGVPAERIGSATGLLSRGYLIDARPSEFVTILNQLRVGEVSEAATKKLVSLSRPVQYHDGIEPTALYALPTQIYGVLTWLSASRDEQKSTKRIKNA